MSSARQAYSELFAKIAKHYFRAEVVTLDPDLERTLASPVTFIGNHSGMNLPWDMFAFHGTLSSRFPLRRQLSVLIAPDLCESRHMQLFGVPSLFHSLGVPANYKNYEDLVACEDHAIAYPEGVDGIAKGFHRRYELQRFATSTVRLHLKYDRQIIPVYTINGEFFNPFAYQIKSLSQLVQKAGVPFWPLGLMTPAYLIFPLVCHIALPAKLTFVIGKPIRLSEWLSDGRQNPLEEPTNEEIAQLTLRLHAHMQNDLFQHAERFGKVRFGIGSFLRNLAQAGFDLRYMIPIVWPLLFHLASQSSWRQRLKATLYTVLLCLPVVGWLGYLILLVVDRQTPTPMKLKPQTVSKKAA